MYGEQQCVFSRWFEMSEVAAIAVTAKSGSCTSAEGAVTSGHERKVLT